MRCTVQAPADKDFADTCFEKGEAGTGGKGQVVGDYVEKALATAIYTVFKVPAKPKHGTATRALCESKYELGGNGKSKWLDMRVRPEWLQRVKGRGGHSAKVVDEITRLEAEAGVAAPGPH